MRYTISLLFAAVLLAVPAAAAEQTREGYVAAVEPICKTDKQASEKDLRGIKKLVKQDKLKQAGTSFAKAAAALEKARRQLVEVPQPLEDAATLGRWLAAIKREATLMGTISTKFKQGDKAKASTLAVKLERNATKTNNLVIAFQFNYCRIDPTKFT